MPGGPSITSSRGPLGAAAIRSSIAASSVSRSIKSSCDLKVCAATRELSGSYLALRSADQNTVVQISVPPRGGAPLRTRTLDAVDLDMEARLMNAERSPRAVAPDTAPDASSLSSRRGVAILILLSIVQFMDVLDASILNIALPSIKEALGFSQQSLQWVIDGYILTYGGFLLLGGRMADLLGRRLMLVTGLVVFAGSSLTGGLAHGGSLLVGARFAQ